MARVARFKIESGEAWYHLHARVAGHKGEYPLARPAVMRRLIDTIEHFSRIYFCEVAAFSIPGSHYHLVTKFEAERPVSREELREKTRLMYPSKFSQDQIDLWSEEQWEHYRRRLFDVSEYMRNIQGAFARWYNHSFQRRGKFWGDRFKSVYLQDKQAVLDCMLYVELNPVRAGLVERPEEWAGSSIYLRELGKDSWLSPLREFLDQRTKMKALEEFRQLLYYRGSVPTKVGQAAIPQEILEKEIARGFKTRGMYRKRLGYFVDGLAIGSEEFLRSQIDRMREEGRYPRRKNPIPQLGGVHLSLREQRGTAVIF